METDLREDNPPSVFGSYLVFKGPAVISVYPETGVGGWWGGPLESGSAPRPFGMNKGCVSP